MVSSSRNSTSGLPINANTMDSFWRWPPDRLSTYALRWSLSPNSLNRSSKGVGES